MSETERERPSATLGLPAPLAAGAADPAVDELGRTGDPEREARRRSDPRDLITDGVVELRKRAAPAARRTAAGSEDCLETMARRAAERAGRPRA